MSTFSESYSSDGYFDATGTYHANGFTAGYIGGSGSAWALFGVVTIPQGATITAATLTPHWRGQNGTPSILIRGAAADNTTAGPTTQAAYYGGARTTATVNYANAATADVTAIVQEVINRSGWASGNGLMLYVQDNGSPTGAYDAAGSPSLSVTYTAAGGGAVAATASGALTLAGTAAGSARVAVSGALLLSGSAAGTVKAAASGALALSGSATATAPFTLTVVPSGASALLSWPAAGASYAVERDGAIVAFGVTGTSYTDTPPSGGSHTYRVGVLA